MDAPAATTDAPIADAADAPATLVADAPGCAISTGTTPSLDGNEDLSKYPAAAQLAAGAMVGSDAAAITWDASRLYVTVTSDGFVAPYEPLHIYLETGTGLDAASPAAGKEYGGLIPALPFSPDYLIAVRRVSDAGTGAYDGVYLPTASWDTVQTALAPATDVFASSDQRTLSVVVPWAALGGCPTEARLVVHVVHGATGNEWKDLLPSTHTPWQAPGGSYYAIDLTRAPATMNWSLR